MNEPQIECFDCMAAASGPHHGYRLRCAGCMQRAMALHDNEYWRELARDIADKTMELPAARAFFESLRSH